jgi:hypothetical protein
MGYGPHRRDQRDLMSRPGRTQLRLLDTRLTLDYLRMGESSYLPYQQT